MTMDVEYYVTEVQDRDTKFKKKFDANAVVWLISRIIICGSTDDVEQYFQAADLNTYIFQGGLRLNIGILKYGFTYKGRLIYVLKMYLYIHKGLNVGKPSKRR